VVTHVASRVWMQHVRLEKRLNGGLGEPEERVEDEALHADVWDVSESGVSLSNTALGLSAHWAIGVCMI